MADALKIKFKNYDQIKKNQIGTHLNWIWDKTQINWLLLGRRKKLTSLDCDGTKKSPTYVRVVTVMPVVTVVTFVTNKLFSANNNF